MCNIKISDQEGVISSIIYGPDERTQITPGTRNVLFTVYAPAGVDREVVKHHLQDIEEYIRIAAPQAQVAILNIYGGEE